jgi:hypothetical protein
MQGAQRISAQPREPHAQRSKPTRMVKRLSWLDEWGGLHRSDPASVTAVDEHEPDGGIGIGERSRAALLCRSLRGALERRASESLFPPRAHAQTVANRQSTVMSMLVTYGTRGGCFTTVLSGKALRITSPGYVSFVQAPLPHSSSMPDSSESGAPSIRLAELKSVPKATRRTEKRKVSVVGCGSDAEVHAEARTNHNKVAVLRSVIEPPNVCHSAAPCSTGSDTRR